MANVLELTRDGISYIIKQLKDKGIIERVGTTDGFTAHLPQFWLQDQYSLKG